MAFNKSKASWMLFFFSLPLFGFSSQKGDTYFETQLLYSHSVPLDFYQNEKESASIKNLGGAGTKVGLGHYLSSDWGHFIYFSMDSYKKDSSKKPSMGPSYFLRFHFWGDEEINLFTEGGVGIFYRKIPVIENGSRWNLTFSLGAGASLQLRKQIYLLIGIKINHFSHLGILKEQSQNSVAFESLSGFLGMSFKF